MTIARARVATRESGDGSDGSDGVRLAARQTAARGPCTAAPCRKVKVCIDKSRFKKFKIKI
jgi:hypothetical protein